MFKSCWQQQLLLKRPPWVFEPWVKPKYRQMMLMKSDWSFNTKPQTECNVYATIDLSNSLSRVHLHLPVWGFPAFHSRLDVAGFTAGGVWDGAGETLRCPSATLVLERFNPGGPVTAASACRSTHGARTQPPEGHRGTAENKHEQIISDIFPNNTTFHTCSNTINGSLFLVKKHLQVSLPKIQNVISRSGIQLVDPWHQKRTDLWPMCTDLLKYFTTWCQSHRRCIHTNF